MLDESSNPTYSATLLAGALDLAAEGYFVFPVRVTDITQAVGQRGVHPIPSWDQVSTRDPNQLRSWFGPGRSWAGTALAIDCGKSGIVVVDLDVKHGQDGPGAWQQLVEDGQVPDAAGAVLAATPTGGQHWYFRADAGPGAVEARNSQGAKGGVAPGIDVRGVGGFVFAPPTRDHRGAYRWLEGVAEPFLPPDQLPRRPDVLLRRAAPAGRRGAGSVPAPRGAVVPAPSGFTLPSSTRTPFARSLALNECAAAVERLRLAEPGGRNATLNETAMFLAHFDHAGIFDRDQVWAWVTTVAEECGLSPTEIGPTLASGWRAGQRDPWPVGPDDPFRTPDARSETVRSGASSQASVGMREPVGAELDAAVTALSERFLDVAGLAAIPRPRPLIRGMLNQRTLAQVVGPYGSLKTFVALDMALSVAAGIDWHERTVAQGKVWYLLAEGVSGLRQRVEAWLEQHPGADLSRFRVLPEATAVRSGDWDVLLALAAQEAPDLVVVDTRARHAEGLEENSASDTAFLVARVDALKVAAAGTVLVVHHTGWDGSRMRGSSAWGGALDTDLLVEKVDGPGGADAGPSVRITSAKQKDAEAAPVLELDTRVVPVGVDEDGLLVTSLAITGAGLERPGVVADDVTGALDVTLEQHPDVLVDLVAVMASVAPAGAEHGITEAALRTLMMPGAHTHPLVRRTMSKGPRKGERGWSRAEIQRAWVLAAAYGWTVHAESSGRFVIRGAADRQACLEEWRRDHPQPVEGAPDGGSGGAAGAPSQNGQK